jgi:hypothetical protein
VIQDEKGRVERIALYNLDEKTKKKLRVGRRLSVVDPYMRMAADGLPAIRVDDPARSVVLLEKVQACHHCAREATKLMSCAKCRKVAYCR